MNTANNSNPLTYDYGCPAVFSWGSFDRSEPSPDYPHGSHDINTLSQYLLSATAFTSGVSMGTGADLPYGNDEDTLKAYKAIFKKAKASDLLFRSRTELINFATLNYDRIGIILEYRSYYFVTMEEHQHLAPQGSNKTGMSRGFVEKNRVGTHLVCEWEGLAKEQVGECIVATAGTNGWWHVHSKLITDMRAAAAERAKYIDLYVKQMKVRPEEEKIIAKLKVELSHVVDWIYTRVRNKEVRAAKEVEGIMKEMLVFEEDG